MKLPYRAAVALGSAATFALAVGMPAQGGTTSTWRPVLTRHYGAATNFSADGPGLALSKTDAWAFGGSNLSGGTAPGAPVAEHWNGKAGHGSAAPAATPGRILSGVSCPRVSSCWAVGDQAASGVTRTLIEHWNGRKWSLTASPSVPGSAGTFLSGVSCPAVLNCWAVGSATLGSSRQEPIAEHWNGSKWSLSVLPEPAGLARLASVWCPGVTRCWAVGSAARPVVGAVSRPLAEHWTGKKWSVVPARASGGFTVLAGVFCRQDTNCWAVGAEAVDARAVGGLAEHWNGQRWSVAATPAAAAALVGVWCLGTDCFATGYSRFPTVIAERWNGRTWSLTPTSPPPVEIVGSLQGVSCATSTSCFAVGVQGQANPQTLIERWQRSRWVKVKSPNPAGAKLPVLRAVFCLSPKACWAVGLSINLNFTGPARTLAEYWNGRSWSIVRTP